jgi:arylsulfatase A-like enzyme
MRVPYLVSWPARLKPGSYEQPVIALDFLPTLVSLAGGSAPQDRVIDGVDLLPYLTGEKQGAPHGRLFWRTQGPQGNHAVRQGAWKLVHKAGSTPELYDLSTDVAESRNLASEQPGKVQELQAAIAEWEKGTIPPIFQSPKTNKKGPKKKK